MLISFQKIIFYWLPDHKLENVELHYSIQIVLTLIKYESGYVSWRKIVILILHLTLLHT